MHDLCYLEIVTPDVEGVARLHAEAFGWTFEPAPELGHAMIASLPGGSVCGIRAPMGEHETPIVRTYLRVDDVAAATRRAESLGATVALDSMEIPGRGRLSIVIVGGVQQGLWEVAG